MTAGLDAALQAFSGRDLALLTGLPEETTLEDAATLLGADPQRFGRWFLGEGYHEAFYCPVAVDGYRGRVRIWFRDGTVLKIQGEWPDPAPGQARVLADLGEPEDVVDYRLDTLVVTGGERVYADRGLAVRVAPADDLVQALSVFPATTAAAYREALGEAPDRYRESPGPGG